MEKITTIAEGLIQLGYPVYFLSGPDFKDYIESIGATYVPIEGKGPGIMAPEDMGKFLTLKGAEHDIFAFNTIFASTIPAQHRTLQRTFADIREQYGVHQPLIYLFDCSFAALAPVQHGAPGIRPHAAMAIGVAPYPGASNDTFPFQSGKHPDTSASAAQIHFEAQQAQYAAYPDREWNAHLNGVLRDMGVTTEPKSLFDMFASAGDTYLQYGVPGFEYPRSDIRDGLRSIGAPIAVGIAERALPSWWEEVLEAKKQGKTVVAVTPSSVVFDNNVLIVPALEALRDREDVFVVATLVNSDVDSLDFDIPRNARVARFIPLDLALPHVDVLITNGGYGTVQQAVRAGVPMIVSGVGQDKLHTGGIINYVGNGIYEAVHQTDKEMLRRAFEEMMRNGSYKAKSEALAKEYKKYNAVEIADAEIQRAVKEALASKPA
jgi:UDP:flavonoid glycosyltransferase YjiC (YdhE family)